MTEDQLRAKFEAAAYKRYLEVASKSAADGTPVEVLGPDGFFWRHPEGAYGVPAVGEVMHLPSRLHGVLRVRRVADGIYSVQHPTIRHAFVTSAGDGIAAVEVAETWFDSLRDVGIYPDGVR